MTPDTGYKCIERNIHRRAGGRFRVMLTRRTGSIYGGMHTDLAEARRVRDKLEKDNPPGKPWDHTPKVERRRTSVDRRRERKAAGLCAECGEEPPAEGLVTCRMCRNIKSAYDKERRIAAKQQNKKASA